MLFLSDKRSATLLQMCSSFLLVGCLLLGCGGKDNSDPLPVPVVTSAPLLAPTPAPVAPPAAAITWLQQAAKPVSSVEPDTSDVELAFLDGMVGDASIVGMGEATHGSSEFQKMKHRVFRYLVEHKGVTAFGLEAQMGRCQRINQYVLTGVGSPVRVLDNQVSWVWSTEEMADLVNWMWAYNSDPAHTQKLTFFGFDMQDGMVEIQQVMDYLRPIDPQAATDLLALYDVYLPYSPFFFRGGTPYSSASESVRIQCQINVQKAYQWMVDHEAAYSAATGAEAYTWAVQMARVVVQNEAMNHGTMERDQAMAENIDWYVKRLGAGAKVALSAHNVHLSKTFPGLFTTGEWLSQRHGSDYFSLGFAFDAGSMNAAFPDPAYAPYYNFGVCTAPPAALGAYEDALTRAGLDKAFLDMRNLDTTLPGPAWFSQPHNLREVGSLWEDIDGWCVYASSLPERFDALVFLRNVSATTILPPSMPLD